MRDQMTGVPEMFEPYLEDHRAETAYIHESSYIDAPCRIGEHTSILHFTHVMANSIIGNHCLIGRNVTINSGVVVGDGVRVMNHTQLNSGVILESEVYCGPSTIFTEPRHVRAETPNISRVSPTLVRRGAHIGANTTVASGFVIGSFAFVEAGTVIDRNIPDFAIVYGNPLKFVGWRCECGQTLFKQTGSRKSSGGPAEGETRCTACGRRYLRQSKWKVLQLGTNVDARSAAIDSHSEFDPSIRTAQGTD